MQDKSTDLSEIYGRTNPSDNIETSVILGITKKNKKKTPFGIHTIQILCVLQINVSQVLPPLLF